MTVHEYPARRRRGWWLRNPRYLAFQLREAGGVVCALYGLILLNMLVQLRDGESAYAAFLNLLRTPPVLYLIVVLFVLVLWHALTSFLLPVTLFLIFFAAPFHLWPGDPAAYATFLAHWKEPLVRLFFFVLIGGSLFHGTHRLKFMLMDAGFKGPAAEALLDLILNGV